MKEKYRKGERDRELVCVRQRVRGVCVCERKGERERERERKKEIKREIDR